MNPSLLESLEFIYKHPRHLFLLFMEKNADRELMKAFFPDVPVCENVSSEYTRQALLSFSKGTVRGLVLPKFFTVGWNVSPPEGKHVAVLFDYQPEHNEYQQAQSRIRRPLNNQEGA